MFLLEPTLSALHFFEFLLTLVRVMHALSHPFLFICILLLCTGARRASELMLLSSPAACTVHPVPFVHVHAKLLSVLLGTTSLAVI